MKIRRKTNKRTSGTFQRPIERQHEQAPTIKKATKDQSSTSMSKPEPPKSQPKTNRGPAQASPNRQKANQRLARANPELSPLGSFSLGHNQTSAMQHGTIYGLLQITGISTSERFFQTTLHAYHTLSK
jgi:hypothetical protein